MPRRPRPPLLVLSSKAKIDDRRLERTKCIKANVSHSSLEHWRLEAILPRIHQSVQVVWFNGSQIPTKIPTPSSCRTWNQPIEHERILLLNEQRTWFRDRVLIHKRCFAASMRCFVNHSHGFELYRTYMCGFATHRNYFAAHRSPYFRLVNVR